MKNILFTLSIIITLVLGFIFLGCSGDDNIISDNNMQSVEIARVTPADGSVNIPSGVSIALKFTGPVDTLSIMRNFHLSGGDSMHEWRDSLNHYGGYGMMNMGMRNHMTEWMDSIHTVGRFMWNAAMDSCEFIPDSMLMNSTEYLCLLYEGDMRGINGGMMGDADHNNDGYHMFGFTTGSMQSNSPKSTPSLPADGSVVGIEK